VDATSFCFAAIPHTLEVTTLGERRVGDTVNLETDVIGKWVKRIVEPYLGALERS
jgi:riboflavin synthase